MCCLQVLSCSYEMFRTVSFFFLNAFYHCQMYTQLRMHTYAARKKKHTMLECVCCSLQCDNVTAWTYVLHTIDELLSVATSLLPQTMLRRTETIGHKLSILCRGNRIWCTLKLWSGLFEQRMLAVAQSLHLQ